MGTKETIRDSTVEGSAWKIKELDEIAPILKTERQAHKTIVHCQGVFDPLHLGHIRHFEEAKKFGDILVVVVTPDRYVNKGPHRPLFSDRVRAEAVAALGCVDYVAINHWPSAVETIQLIQPDFYVKGSEYRTLEDHTGAIGREKKAVESYGGRLVFTDDITFSASTIVNHYLPFFPKEVRDYLKEFNQKYTHDDVIRYLESAASLDVLVIGESIVDEYIYCDSLGASIKEPVLSVKYADKERFAGGALAVANNISGFCRKTELLTCLGEQNPEEAFIRERLHENIHIQFFNKSQSPTIIKRRYVENYLFQKLFEVNTLNDQPLTQEENETFCSWLEEKVPHFDLVIVSDFGHGLFTPEARNILCEKAKFLAVNTQFNAANRGLNTITNYTRADFVCLAFHEMAIETRKHVGDINLMNKEIARLLQSKKILTTYGKKGSICYSPDEGFCEVPAFAHKKVDRTGLGTAILPITALCALQGAGNEILAFIGNVVGAQAIATIGHREPIQKPSLLRNIQFLMK